MASATAQLKIQIQADLANAKTELAAINKQVASLDPTAQVTAQSLREIDDSLSGLSSVVVGATTAFLSLQTAMMAIKVSDDYNQMASRIKMVTNDTEGYVMVQERLMEVADRTYKPLETIQELFVRSSSAMKELGYSTKETVDFIDSISSSLTINSANTDRANLAIAALNRSMTSGKVAAQEWEMVMNVMPTIAADIALYLRETGKEATATEQSVKNMAKEGQVSMELMAQSAIYAKDKNAELAENMPTTLGDAVTKLRNHLTAYLGETNNSIGASEKLVEAVNFVTAHLDTFAKVVTALVTGGLARYGVMLVQNTLVTIKACVAKRTLAAQELALAEAQFAATRAALSEATGHMQAVAAAKAHQAALAQLVAAQKAASVGMMGLGLPGLAMTVAAATASFLLFRDNTTAVKDSVVDLNISLDEAIEKFNLLDTAAKRNAAIADTKKTVAELKDEYKELISQIHTMDRGLFKPEVFTDFNGFVELIAKSDAELRKALSNERVDWDNLSNAVANSNSITDQYKNNLLSLIGQLKDKDDQIQKGIALTQQQEEANKSLSNQDREAAQAKVQFTSAANNLNDEIKKLTTSVDGNIKSSTSMSDVVATLESNINNLKNTAGATPERIDELTKALDKLKEKQQEINNINNKKFIANLKKQNETAGMSNWDKQRYEINNNDTWSGNQKEEALALAAKGEAQEKATKAAEKAKSASDSLSKSNLSYVQGLEKQVATMNLGKMATLEYELSQKKLSGALLERAQASMEALRAAQQLANAKTNSTLQIEILRLTGNDYQADLMELENKFKETTENLKKEGNETGIALAKELFDAGKAKAQLDKIKAELDKVFANQSRQEQSIQAQVEAGLITQYQGQKNLTELHKQTASTVEKYLPELEKAANMPGAMGEQSKAYLTEVNNQLLALKKTTSELENAFRNGLQDGIQSSIEGLVKGTMNLQDALKNFVDSVASNMLNVVAQNMAEQATNGIMGGLSSLNSMFSFGGDAASAVGDATATAGLTATGEAATIAATSLTGLGTTATASVTGLTGLSASSTSAATGMSAASGSATILSSAAMSAATALQAVAASSAVSAGKGVAGAAVEAAGAVAAATGGHITGAGTGTSDSIPAMLSNGEFVTRAAVVKQPGMRAFMEDVNSRGWGAVEDLQRVKHSTGGLAGSPTPRVSAPIAPSAPNIGSMDAGAIENVNNNSTTLKNSQNFYILDDPKKFSNSILNDEGTQEAIEIHLTQNSQKYRSIFQAG